MTDRNRINSLIVLLIVFGISVLGYFIVSKPKDLDDELSPISSNEINVKDLTGESKPASIEGYAKISPLAVEKSQAKIFNTTVNYEVPGDTQTLELSLVLDNGVITEINTNLTKSGRDSNGYQSKFEKSYKNLVLGKNIKDINLSRVGGASLTTKAFMDAITAVKNQL